MQNVMTFVIVFWEEGGRNAFEDLKEFFGGYAGDGS
jgi:hypothetical protein